MPGVARVPSDCGWAAKEGKKGGSVLHIIDGVALPGVFLVSVQCSAVQEKDSPFFFQNYYTSTPASTLDLGERQQDGDQDPRDGH